MTNGFNRFLKYSRISLAIHIYFLAFKRVKTMHQKPTLRWLAWLIENCFLMDWFYYNLIILIVQCKMPYRNLGKALLFSRNQVLCLKIWKLWRVPYSSIFFVETSLTFSTYQCLQKRLRDFFYFSIDLELFAKIRKTGFLHTCFFTFLLITQDLNKIPNTLL